MGIQLTALLGQFDAACTAAADLAEAATAHFEQHPDAEIITSFPGLGSLAGARVLAEIGDDRTRFADARGLKAYAGAAPITRASGKKTVVLHRHIKNRRLAAVGPIWALGSLRASPGARRHFDARRPAGDWNHQAQRHLFNKFLGQLHHCLQTAPALRRTSGFSTSSRPRSLTFNFVRCLSSCRERARLYGDTPAFAVILRTLAAIERYGMLAERLPRQIVRGIRQLLSQFLTEPGGVGAEARELPDHLRSRQPLDGAAAAERSSPRVDCLSPQYLGGAVTLIAGRNRSGNQSGLLDVADSASGNGFGPQSVYAG